MTPGMLEALIHTSLFYSADPEQVCSRVVEAVAAYYGSISNSASQPGRPPMVMLNLLEGSCVRARTVANRHRFFMRGNQLDLQHTLCKFALSSGKPLLIQNAAEHPDFRNHPVVRLKLRRYLGVPLWSTEGEAIGTLCLMDDRVEDLLGDDDVQFFSLLAMRVSNELEREKSIVARLTEQQRYAHRLEKTAEEKRNFVAMVIHDLRQPLTAMLTELYLVQRSSDAGAISTHLNAIDERANMLARLLDELMLYDQVEAGKSHFSVEAINIGSFLKECVAAAASPMANTEVDLILEHDPVLPPVITDATKLRHVVMNLLGNAIKYTQVGSITVRSKRTEANSWVLEVIDTGIGITDAEIPYACEPYYTGGGTASGAGLGLAIAQRLCTALHGVLSISSQAGSGASFRVELPIIMLEDGTGANQTQ